ncbi:MAG: HEPN domain-containing protein [bacterium]|nr:HEPN domain-containing protein [bacterium]
MKNNNEISANLERAEQSIQAAQELAKSGYYDISASRSYYGAFYAAHHQYGDMGFLQRRFDSRFPIVAHTNLPVIPDIAETFQLQDL